MIERVVHRKKEARRVEEETPPQREDDRQYTEQGGVGEAGPPRRRQYGLEAMVALVRRRETARVQADVHERETDRGAQSDDDAVSCIPGNHVAKGDAGAAQDVVGARIGKQDAVGVWNR